MTEMHLKLQYNLLGFFLGLQCLWTMDLNPDRLNAPAQTHGHSTMYQSMAWKTLGILQTDLDMCWKNIFRFCPGKLLVVPLLQYQRYSHGGGLGDYIVNTGMDPHTAIYFYNYRILIQC